MKRALLLGVLGTVLLVGLAPLGGCVSRTEYEKVRSANRLLRDDLTKAGDDLRKAEMDKTTLSADLEDSRANAKARETDLALAEEHNRDLKLRFEKLAEEYRKLAGRRPPVPPVGVNVLPSEVDKELRAFAQGHPELLEYLPKFGMVKLKADLTFKLGSDYVRPAAAEALREFAKIVSDPAAERFNIYVAGHTDNTPIVKETTRRRHPDNLYLSVHRAVAVGRVLLKAGMPAERVGAMGFGEHHPVAPNKASGGGNSANRRVEIWIVPPSRYLTKEMAVE